MKVKHILIGIGCGCAANFIFVTNSILVNRYKLMAAELCFLKAVMQMAVFTTIFFASKLRISSDKKPSDKKGLQWSSDWQVTLSVLGCCVTLAAMTLTAYVGVKLLPVSDLVVFGHTSSVFTLLFSACILK